MSAILKTLLAIAVFSLAAPASAQRGDAPYWASIRVTRLNMRVGPAESYRILWVYKRKQLPVKVLRIMEGWRLVEDPSGQRGWVLGRFLTTDRAAIVIGNGPADLRESDDSGARLLWRLAPGVVGKLGDCDQGWCAMNAGGRSGYILQDRLWGAGEP